jgi:hypothetical protein
LQRKEFGYGRASVALDIWDSVVGHMDYYDKSWRCNVQKYLPSAYLLRTGDQQMEMLLSVKAKFSLIHSVWVARVCFRFDALDSSHVDASKTQAGLIDANRT